MTHKQWLYQNSDIHQRIDGLTSHQHTLLSDRIHELITMPPADLLPCHCHLLHHNFFNLGADSNQKRQLWVASMESAISAAKHASSGHHTPGSLQKFYMLPTWSCPRRSPFTMNTTSRRTHQMPPRSPRQQTLPASFWIPPQAPSPPYPPPVTHTTDLTGTDFHLHWKRK